VLKLKCDELISIYGFKFKLRCYSKTALKKMHKAAPRSSFINLAGPCGLTLSNPR
jgi:hypothetical protein